MKSGSVIQQSRWLRVLISLVGVGFLTTSACSSRPLSVEKIPQGIRVTEVFRFIRTDDHRQLYSGPRGEILSVHMVSGLSPGEFGVESKRKRAMLEWFLKPSSDPYFGTKERGPTCDVTQLPPWQELESAANYKIVAGLFATEKFVYGSCSDKNDVFKSQLLWLYCAKERTFYDIRLFYPRSEPWRDSPIADCN